MLFAKIWFRISKRDVLYRLCEQGFVIRIGFGYYRVHESVPEERDGALKERESAPKVFDSALCQKESAQERTLAIDKKSPQKRTQGARKCTLSAQYGTQSPETETVPPDAQEYSLKQSKEKQSKEEFS